MRIDIVSLFPAMFAGPLGESMTKRAMDRGLLDIHITNLRDFAFDKHKQVDDSPFGGGSGMVLKPEPMFRALCHIKAVTDYGRRRVLLMSPAGQAFTQDKAKELASYDQLIFLCGHYEGFDARIEERLPDEAISLGDYVLTGGELPAMVVIDAVSRMIPGVLGSEESAPTDSFYDGLLGYPQYTRPREFEGLTVPDVLLSGDHAQIARWRRNEALRRTKAMRPDLLSRAAISESDRRFLASLEDTENGLA
ncbi:MAG: tRNA (guanosine(37)-N1)-methyltransferase TrmD [Schwartzia sp. (in: firmicutes)]